MNVQLGVHKQRGVVEDELVMDVVAMNVRLSVRERYGVVGSECKWMLSR